MLTLSSDMKRVLHSAHAHRQLKSRESRQSSGQIVLDRSEFLRPDSSCAHGEFTKTNMAKLSGGIKHFNCSDENVNSRACNIQ